MEKEMLERREFYIGGHWVKPNADKVLEVINPATEAVIGSVSLGDAEDVDRAVVAARTAFKAFSTTTPAARLALLRRIEEVYEKRFEEIAKVISMEVGAPITLAREIQAATGKIHLATYSAILEEFSFESDTGSTRIAKEPIGVCGLITPWNWPINQIACKVIPALAAGCTVVLKPSEVTPLSACLFADVLDEAGVPPGVFNLVNGEGPVVGEAIASHPDIDMVSLTGSTRAGTAVARAAAESVKRVTQELGGKSPYIVLPDADLEVAVEQCTNAVLMNSGQSCAAPTRLLVPAQLADEAAGIASAIMKRTKIGSPENEDTEMGPVVSHTQFEKIQRLIAQGIDEGARLVCGGPGREDGFDKGYFARPTVFADVSNDMTIAREEIFGPVLVVIPYKNEEEAIRIANDTDYGLAAYVSSRDLEAARRVAGGLRAGSVYLNGAWIDPMAPFGGYKRSGNGREWGPYGLEEYLETKSILGFAEAPSAQ